MKIFLSVFISILFITCKQDLSIPKKLIDSIQSIKNQYAPDKRTAIFNVTAIATKAGIILKGETAIPKAKIELLFALQGLNIIDSIEIWPSKDLGSELYGVISVPVANMRSGPAHSSELSNQVLCGTVIRLFKLKGGWVYAQTPDDYLGWIDIEAVHPLDSNKLSEWLAEPKAFIVQDQTYIVDQPLTTANVISPLSAGAIVIDNGSNGDQFNKVSLADGRNGYIKSDHIVPLKLWQAQESKQQDAVSILNTARGYLGRPYLWGGTSANAMDCSGFTKMVFLRHDLILPRDASQQVKVGLPIETDTSFANLQPGDFLFFGRKATDSLPEKITHVAMYLGNGKIIHSTGHVRIQSIKRGDSTFAENRFKTFVRATRPLASPKEHGIFGTEDIKWFD